MRVPKPWVPLIAKKVIDDLITKGLIDSRVSVEELILETEKLITDELTVEDRLNEEVREVLKKHSSEIEKGHLDYRKMFELTKRKIIEERGLIL